MDHMEMDGIVRGPWTGWRNAGTCEAPHTCACTRAQVERARTHAVRSSMMVLPFVTPGTTASFVLTARALAARTRALILAGAIRRKLLQLK